jgi:phage gpG-like protein
MSTRNENEVPNVLAMAQQLKRDVVSYTAVYGLNFFLDSFQKQGFTDRSFEAWVKRKNDSRPGGALLIKSAGLRNSLRTIEKSAERIVWGSNSPYGKIHNEGGVITITLTKKARKFFWFMYYTTNEARFKWMAISKKDKLSIKIPKRQFVGHSETLMGDLDKWFITEVEKRFKSI